MTVMVSEVYDALIDAGASEEKARKAAEAVYDSRRSSGIERQRLTLIQWMLALLLGGVASLVIKAFV